MLHAAIPEMPSSKTAGEATRATGIEDIISQETQNKMGLPQTLARKY